MGAAFHRGLRPSHCLCNVRVKYIFTVGREICKLSGYDTAVPFAVFPDTVLDQIGVYSKPLRLRSIQTPPSSITYYCGSFDKLLKKWVSSIM